MDSLYVEDNAFIPNLILDEKSTWSMTSVAKTNIPTNSPWPKKSKARVIPDIIPVTTVEQDPEL